MGRDFGAIKGAQGRGDLYGMKRELQKELASVGMSTLSGQVIVCENFGASWLPFHSLGSTKTTRAKRSNEAVWLGGEAQS